MASIQATAHAAAWQQQRCVCVCVRVCMCATMYCVAVCMLLSTSPSSHQPHSPIGLFLLLLLTFPLLSLACLLCTSISHKFISAATRTRCVPSHPSPLPVQSGTPGDFSSSLRSLAARCPLPPLLVCGSALRKHVRLLVAVFVCIFIVHC